MPGKNVIPVSGRAVAGVELVGADRTLSVLRDLQGRFATQSKWFETTVQSILVDAEMEVFNAWSPHFDSGMMAGENGRVRSTGVRYGLEPGSTRETLTTISGPTGQKGSMGQPIRFITEHSFTFGSGNFYAAFQRKIGGPSGKPRGRKRTGPSLILAGNAENYERIMAAAAEYLFHPLLELDDQ